MEFPFWNEIPFWERRQGVSRIGPYLFPVFSLAVLLIDGSPEFGLVPAAVNDEKIPITIIPSCPLLQLPPLFSSSAPTSDPPIRSAPSA